MFPFVFNTDTDTIGQTDTSSLSPFYSVLNGLCTVIKDQDRQSGNVH